jgi:hypothetical protein
VLSERLVGLLGIFLCVTCPIKSFEMKHLKNNDNNNNKITGGGAAATIFTLAIIFVLTTPQISASTTADTNATTTTTTSPSSSGLELSAQPVWDEHVRTTGIIPINETHSMAIFEGNGTMTALDTGETINMTNNGTAIGSLVPQANNTVISYGRENVFSVDDGDTSAIAFSEIVQYDPTTFQGKGLVIAVFDNNATGSLAPFNGILVVGTHEEDPSIQTVTIRLWEWESGIPLSSTTTDETTDQQDATTQAANVTTEGGGAGGVEEGSGVTNQPQVTTPSPGELQASVEQPHDRS